MPKGGVPAHEICGALAPSPFPVFHYFCDIHHQSYAEQHMLFTQLTNFVNIS